MNNLYQKINPMWNRLTNGGFVLACGSSDHDSWSDQVNFEVLFE
jgi:hypothetical protein